MSFPIGVGEVDHAEGQWGQDHGVRLPPEAPCALPWAGFGERASALTLLPGWASATIDTKRPCPTGECFKDSINSGQDNPGLRSLHRAWADGWNRPGVAVGSSWCREGQSSGIQGYRTSAGPSGHSPKSARLSSVALVLLRTSPKPLDRDRVCAGPLFWGAVEDSSRYLRVSTETKRPPGKRSSGGLIAG